MADDLGYSDVGCYGARGYSTPAIDGLAKEGIRLTQGYANSCVCSATRTALITGRYQYRLRVGLEEPLSGVPGDPQLPAGQPTLPSMFRGLGYRTGLFGKWHLGFESGKGPLDHGYDHFFGIPHGGADYFTHEYGPFSGEPGPYDGLYLNDKPISRPGYLTDLVSEEAQRWIAESRQPFLASLHFNAPHWPWEGPDDEAVSRQLKDISHKDGGSIETYAKMVVRMDENIGQVLRALRSREMENDTIVVFTSDNGGERFSDVWPLVGMKGQLFEGGIRVPLIIRWPGKISPNRVSSQIMTSMDFLPTLLAAAGGAPDSHYPSDGENLLPVLMDEKKERDRQLFWRHRHGDQAAVRAGDWKYLRYAGTDHLYNLSNDLRERGDLKGRHPEKLAELKEAYDRWNATMLPYPIDSYSYESDFLLTD